MYRFTRGVLWSWQLLLIYYELDSKKELCQSISFVVYQGSMHSLYQQYVWSKRFFMVIQKDFITKLTARN